MTPLPVDDTDPPPHARLRDTLLMLESLLQNLTDSNNSAGALRATVDAAREGTRAEVAFWHSKTGTRASCVSGESPMSPEQCAQFARKLLAVVPKDLEVFRWVNPDPPTPTHPTAAQPKGNDQPVAVLPPPGGWDRNYDTSGFDRNGYDPTGLDLSADRNYDTGGFDRRFDRSGLSRP